MTGTDRPAASQISARWNAAIATPGDVRFSRRLPHPPEKVWRALTEAEHLAAWFPTTVEGELRPARRCSSVSAKSRCRRWTAAC